MNVLNGTSVIADTEQADSNDKIITEKILHVLGLYPILSQTMLQAALGPGLGPKMWRPVLSKLIHAGVIVKDEIRAVTPSQRNYSYTRIMLRSTYWSGIPVAAISKHEQVVLGDSHTSGT